ncbi:hypothetical protein [Paractinoplanes lichenicola]|uniref:Uncharacterized protein n=1 Tax=Paractinoplanes lichenicola TaxID=2802976 RepID=A0ABS1W369_9ACTN|nr:hypothetical protein [Actinoplanes lichenicola]MBL7261184.1 hypothetical protein [Actinoplanes lichenicola]
MFRLIIAGAVATAALVSPVPEPVTAPVQPADCSVYYEANGPSPVRRWNGSACRERIG